MISNHSSDAMVGRSLLFLCACTVAVAQDAQSRVVSLAQGPVRGYHGTDGDYYAFYGIPYATAPTGRDKFKAPMAAPTWTETFDAVNQTIMCPQTFLFGPSNQVEQCLIANVYVSDTEETNLPVLVHIHGGGFLTGFGNQMNPKRLVSQGKIIAVNFNYRLGVHGFLCLGTEHAPGNAGMWDMVALLRWVEDNIAQFGGNPNDVTIDGYSAGSVAADLLTFSKSAEGLFNRVILESGVAISPWGVQMHPLDGASQYATLLNFTSDNVYELEKFYLTKPLDVLVSAQYLNGPSGALAFVPCVERNTGSPVFLDDAPINILKKNEYIKRPYLTGFTEMEGRLRVILFHESIELLNKNFEIFLPSDLQFETHEERKVIAKRVKEFYFGASDVTKESIQAFVNFQTDSLFSYPALRSVRLQVEAGNRDMFLYKYSFFDMSQERQQFPGGDVQGATHCAQTEAVFDNGFTDPSLFSHEYQQVRNLTRELWTNFIRTGRPIPDGSTFIDVGGWPPATADRGPYMSIDNPTRLEPGTPWADRIRFWDEIYDSHYRVPAPPPQLPTRDFP